MDEMKLIGIDLDGTLLNSDQSISQKNARTMKHLPEDCFPFICEEIIEKDAISIYKFFIFIPNRQLKANIFNHLKKMLNVSVTESAPVNIEIVPQNVSKGVVFDRLESIYNLKKPLRIAIGDSLNDLSMFESADISFAMGNSHQEIMKKADYVTVSNDKDGVSQAFERILTI